MSRTQVQAYAQQAVSAATDSSATLVEPTLAWPAIVHPQSIPPRPPRSVERDVTPAGPPKSGDEQVLPLRPSVRFSTAPTIFHPETRTHNGHDIAIPGRLSAFQAVNPKQTNDSWSHHSSPAAPRTFVTWLKRPILPAIHLFLVLSHLAMAITIPYLLVRYMIQPLVLWLILAVCLVVQIIYLIPGLVMELIGLIRGRPIASAWLQSGTHTIFFSLILIPQSLALFLLMRGDQLPPCPSPWHYRPSEYPTFLSSLPGSPCQALPTVVRIAIVDYLTVFFDLVLAIFAIDRDYRIRCRRRKEEQRRLDEDWLMIEVVDGLSPILETPNGFQSDHKISTSENGEPEQKGSAQRRGPVGVKKVSRRWLVGVGGLLWAIEVDMSSRRT